MGAGAGPRILFFAVLLIAPLARAESGDHFVIQVIDARTHRGVPLVELKTTNDISWWTDSNGVVAFDEPGLMDLDVYFHVASPAMNILSTDSAIGA